MVVLTFFTNFAEKYNGKIGVCCYSSLAERSAENHENSVFTSIDYQSIINNSQTGFL